MQLGASAGVFGFRAPSRMGLGVQSVPPPVAVYHMRHFAQSVVARKQLEFFAKYYATRKGKVWNTHIDYDWKDKCADAPLSWKLDAEQQQCIVDTWNRVLQEQSDALTCIDDYLAGGDPGNHCGNPAVGSNQP